MECTQRLECTQELYDTHTEKTCPEQIGFLGICGAKHPVLKGPNKIGRDPQTCSIIINLNSVSRQHAVINVLNSKEFMLMDLDSANKTKLQNKTLQPYIPHPLRNGDTVQFGDIFGVFRLLEEDDALPMTQAIDIPETPVVAYKHVTKLHKAPTTVIPESPDVSDREDSFITPSQPIGGRSRLFSSSFIKLNNNKTQTLPGSSPKTYNNRKSPKLSTSLSFIDKHNTSLNESFISLKFDNNVTDDIHEADTQAPNPIANDSADSIYTADTQIPPERGSSPSIHSLDTQVPSTEHLPLVRKIDGQHEMLLDIYAANKENNRDIFNAETQPFGFGNHSTDGVNKNKSNVTNKTMSDCSGEAETKEKINTSEEELLFDDVDGEILEEDFHSQNILQDDLPFKENAIDQSKTPGSPIPPKRNVSDGTTDCEEIEGDMLLTQKIPELPSKVNEQQTKIEAKKDPKSSMRIARAKSDSSTDCEDIDMVPTQIIPALPIRKDNVKENSDKKRKIRPAKRINRIQSDSSTDCEDIDFLPTQKIPEKKATDDDDVTDCEDDVVEIKTNEPPVGGLFVDLVQDDIATQIIDLDGYRKDRQPLEDMPTQIIDTNSKNVALEDQPTQIIEEVVPKNIQNVKKSFDEIISPFKIPLQSPIRVKSKDIPKMTPKGKTDKNKSIDVDVNYYNATQDIYEDLCSQREKSDDGPIVASNADDEVVPCSVEDYKVKDMFANIERDLSPTKNHDVLENKDDMGGNANVAKLKKVPSDTSDVEFTPKKVKQFIFTDSDLPDSQEIKTSMMSYTRSEVTESSSESEPENCSEDDTLFLKRKKKTVPKLDLTKIFEKLPERVITRQRKPTFKLLSGGEVSKHNSTILKPSYLTEQEDQVDEDIISENIKRLKTFGKGKTNKDTKKQESIKEEKKESSSRKKTDNKRDLKEKIKVKIEKPKRKDTKSKTESSAQKSAESEKNITKDDSLDSTSTTKATTRRTRSKKNENGSQNTEKKSVSPENIKKEPDNNRKRTNNKREKERSVSPEIEVRRSKRQQKAKEKNDDKIKPPTSILKKSILEQSTVYNISSSSSESPKNLKRSLVEDSDVPSSKRTRSHNNINNDGINNASLRATPARVVKTQHVLLTAFPSAEVKQKLEKLGAVIVTDVMECSVVLTMQIKRTFKLLCAVGLGRPIVGPGWVQACADTNIIVDPWLYLVKDEPAEKRFQFSLHKTLNGRRNFLKGYNVSSTLNVQPNAAEMKLIVECSGGTWKEGGPNWVCVSCSKDNGLWPALRKRGATVVSTEFILGGVLRQKLDIASNTFP